MSSEANQPTELLRSVCLLLNPVSYTVDLSMFNTVDRLEYSVAALVDYARHPEEYDDNQFWVSQYIQAASYLDIFKVDPEVCFRLMEAKNKDYGDRPIRETGLIGIAIRMTDKHYRLINILGKESVGVPSESVRDTIMDIYNYTLLALGLIKLEEPQTIHKVPRIDNV